MGMKQVKAITMIEARNGTHYTDLLSVKGVAQALAFSIGVTMGGKRPRTLTAIKLAHCMLKVGKTNLGSECVLVPQIKLKFIEEKFDDEQGPRARECCDVPHSSGYQQDLWTSVAFWMYRLLVMRGVFEKHDPILTSAVGDVLNVRSECQEYYLFCDMKANYWIDTDLQKQTGHQYGVKDSDFLLSVCSKRGSQ